jgi:adenylate cyclase
MATEIERKWVTTDAPPPAGVSMRQGYLAVDGDVTVRLRITAQSAVFTVKAGEGLARAEVEIAVDPEEAEVLWPHTNGRIEKTRTRIDLPGGHVAEVDHYAGELDGLTTVEVEFDSVEAAEQFEPPAWFGREVTGDRRWSNASLSRHGRPD